MVQFTEIRRVRLTNREPVSLELTWLPKTVGEKLEKADLVTRDIFLVLKNDCGIPLGHADLAIDAVLADSDLTQALEVEEGAQIMRIEMKFRRGVQPLVLFFEQPIVQDPTDP